MATASSYFGERTRGVWVRQLSQPRINSHGCDTAGDEIHGFLHGRLNSPRGKETPDQPFPSGGETKAFLCAGRRVVGAVGGEGVGGGVEG